MSDIKKINHVAIVVENIDEALKFWRDSLGLIVDHVEDVPSQQSQVAFLPVGDSEIELVAPTSLESGMAKYLQSKGGGMHHLCFEVNDIEKVLTSLKEKEVRLINNEPLVLPGRKMAFVHPKATGGVLVELYELIN
ncbi:MAG: methylmalonyl-CoA epimerase [Anaerolineaceae bacterium]|nr:methylmalonyl-CoA epimerase [Anaerolineaceae bacterium]